MTTQEEDNRAELLRTKLFDLIPKCQDFNQVAEALRSFPTPVLTRRSIEAMQALPKGGAQFSELLRNYQAFDEYAFSCLIIAFLKTENWAAVKELIGLTSRELKEKYAITDRTDPKTLQINVVGGRVDIQVRGASVSKDKPAPALLESSTPATQGNEGASSSSGVDQPIPFRPQYIKEFEIIHRLGSGGFGIVVEAKKKNDDGSYQSFAIKRTPISSNSYWKEQALKEVKALKTLKHKNIVQCYDAWIDVEKSDPDWSAIINSDGEVRSYENGEEDDEDLTLPGSMSSQETSHDSSGYSESMITTTYLYIQQELCQEGTLRNWLDEDRANRDLRQIKNMFAQIVDAVEYIHDKGMLHRDLKTDNIFLVAENGFEADGHTKQDKRWKIPKVGDFGLVGTLHDGNETLGKAETKAPLKKDHNPKEDIYYLGIILFEMIFPLRTGTGTDHERDIELEKFRKLQTPEAFATSCIDKPELIIGRMMSPDPASRPEAKEIKSWLTEDTWN